MASGYLSGAQVMADLGGQVVEAHRLSVRMTRSELLEHRELHPSWVAEHSERGLANWVHDRMWAHLMRALEGVPHVSVVDRGPMREIYVGARYRLRLERHSDLGAVSSYPTPTAMSFMNRGQLTLDGLDEIRLCVGYRWDSMMREVGAAVLSLRDGQEDIIWVEELPEPALGPVAMPIHGPGAPQLPEIDLPARRTRRAGGAEPE